MKEGMPQNINNEKKPTPPDNSRRGFLKNMLFASAGLALGDKLRAAPAIESNEKPPIITRPQWDDAWNQISTQYSLKLGQKFSVTLNGKTFEKFADVLPYFDQNLKYENLKEVYRRCAIHHTDILPSGTPTEEARTTRDTELMTMGFNDVGYHFMIGSDGTIMEGRPLGRVGSNAGQSVEANEYVKANLPEGISSIAQSTGDAYRENLKKYITAMKMDPDYGTVGIVMCGRFNTDKQRPPKEQMQALTKLLNWIKTDYDIPVDNILYHSEIDKKVVIASGLTPFRKGGVDTVCPGVSFPPPEVVKHVLSADTNASKNKSILLDVVKSQNIKPSTDSLGVDSFIKHG